MAMTANQLDVIEAVAKGDIDRARLAARAAVAEDQSKKNAIACELLARQLDPARNPNIMEMPREVKGLLIGEDPAESFLPGRYYLSPREDELFARMRRLRRVGDELAEMRISYPNTTMLYGPTGTGKTTFGRFVAYKFELPFYYLNFANVVGSHLGETSGNLARVFSFVRRAPCVLMLDEIDCVSMRREGGHGGITGEMNRVTITLMQEMDRLSGQCVVIGATNRIDMIDDALLRRFALRHEVSLPKNAVEAAMVVTSLLGDVGIDADFHEVAKLGALYPGKSQACLIGRTIEAIIEHVETGEALSLRSFSRAE